MDIGQEITVLKNNIRELQQQLAQAHIRIAELLSDKSASNEEVIKEKQFIQEITGELSRVNTETEQKMKQKMNDVPQMLDSRPIKPKLHGTNEKYVTVDDTGSVQYLEE